MNRSIIDWSAIAVAAGTFIEILPAVASFLSVIWLALRIYQTIKEIKSNGGPRP